MREGVASSRSGAARGWIGARILERLALVRALFLVVFVSFGCGSSSVEPGVDAGADASASRDAGASRDAAFDDADRTDGAVPIDAGADDGGSSDAGAGDGGEGATDAGTPVAWTAGAPLDRTPFAAIQPLPGELVGPPIWVSNNPEIVRGPGWTVQHARTDAVRGGAADPVEEATAYLFHINRSGGPLYLHVVATNPQREAITVSARGIGRTNAEAPLTGAGTGPSYEVAEAWLRGEVSDLGTHRLEPARGVELLRLRLPEGAMADARLEVQGTGGLFLYGVLTTSGATSEAIDRSQGAAAPGDVYEPGPDRFGREAGLYTHSGWEGRAALDVPGDESWLAMAFNTEGKFSRDGVRLQEQTAPARTRLDDSAERTWGNYGHRYDVTLVLRNASAEARRVRVFFASNVVGSSDSPSFTWNAPLRVNGELRTLWTRPTQPRQLLVEVTVPAGGEVPVRIETVVPGLVTANAHLLLHAQP